MGKISPIEILRKYGKWITCKDFLELVAKDRSVTPRQAINIIKKEGKDLQKHFFYDGKLIYGLPEFGPPTWDKAEVKTDNISIFHKVLLERFWIEHDEIFEDRGEGLVFGPKVLLLFDAWEKTQRFAELLPNSTKKNDLKNIIKEIHDRIYENGRIFYPPGLFFSNEDRLRILFPKAQIIYNVLPEVWEKIAEIVQEF
jgi:hypothetical protein